MNTNSFPTRRAGSAASQTWFDPRDASIPASLTFAAITCVGTSAARAVAVTLRSKMATLSSASISRIAAPLMRDWWDDCRAPAQSVAPGESLVRKERVGQLGAVAHVELAVDVAEVELDRLRAQEQRVGDALIRPALGDQHRDLQLLRGQLVAAGPRP